MNMQNNDAKELKEMLDVVGEKVPTLLKSVLDSVYSEEAGTQMGKAVGSMYKELVNSGMDKADAIGLVKEYISTLKNASNFGN